MSTNQTWYDIQNAAGVTDVYLYGQIGRYEIPASAFLDALLPIKSSTINVHINSQGGGVDDGIAIFNALKNHPARVHTIADSLVASIASVIFQAGDERTMLRGSTMMIHEPRLALDAVVVGDAEDMRGLAAEATKQADYLDLVGGNLAEIYATAAGGDEASWRERMKAETWYRAQAAVDAGLADSVTPAKAKAQAFNLAECNFKHIPDWLTAEPTPDPVIAPVVIAAPTAIEQVQRMKIPAADKRRAIAHLKAQGGAIVAA